MKNYLRILWSYRAFAVQMWLGAQAAMEKRTAGERPRVAENKMMRI
jgi:hypothetical protein